MTAPVIDAAKLAELERVAREATQGPWCADDFIVMPGDTPESWHVFEQREDDPPLASLSWLNCEANARHIAAFNPLIAIALISRIRELEAERASKGGADDM